MSWFSPTCRCWMVVMVLGTLLTADRGWQVASAQEEGQTQRRSGRGGFPGGGFGGGFPGGGGGYGLLLQQEPVQKSLDLSDDQKAFLQLLQEDSRDKMQKAFEEMRNEDGGSREERTTKMRETIEKVQSENESQIKEIIGEEKFTRLKQIQLQVNGVTTAFLNPKLKEDLKITEEQVEQFQEAWQTIRQEAFSGMQGNFQNFREMSDEERTKLREEMTKRGQEMRDKSVAKAMEILTDEQKSKWKELIGEPIDFKLDLGGMGWGGFGGFGGRGGFGGERGNRPRNQNNDSAE